MMKSALGLIPALPSAAHFASRASGSIPSVTMPITHKVCGIKHNGCGMTQDGCGITLLQTAPREPSEQERNMTSVTPRSRVSLPQSG
jgi:hypothetical protein